MKRSLKRIEIVFPCHNRRELTIQCLKSLTRIQKAGLDVHIVVVDDGSTDGTSDAIRAQFPDVRVIEGSGDLWYTEGTNVGIRAALENGPDYILAINNDSVFDDMFLSYLVETAERHKGSVVGPLLLLWDQPHKLFQTAPVWKTGEGGWHHWHEQTIWTIPDKPWQVDLIVGNCVLLPAGVFAECGLMDARRFPNFGDAEYTPRIKRAGYSLIIDPRSRVFCQPNDVAPRLRNRNAFDLVRDLFVDLKNPASLRRTFLSHIHGGPSVIKGTLAFVALLGRMASNYALPSRPRLKRSEPPLSVIFANDVLDS